MQRAAATVGTTDTGPDRPMEVHGGYRLATTATASTMGTGMVIMDDSNTITVGTTTGIAIGASMIGGVTGGMTGSMIGIVTDIRFQTALSAGSSQSLQKRWHQT